MAGLSKILIVEDNVQIADMYVRVLERNAFQCVTATTVDDALEKAKVFAPDVIFLDIMLPGGKSGLDALMTFRTNPEYGCTKAKIVMLTNLGLTDKIENVWEEYADGYVVKAEIVPHEILDIITSLQS